MPEKKPMTGDNLECNCENSHPRDWTGYCNCDFSFNDGWNMCLDQCILAVAGKPENNWHSLMKRIEMQQEQISDLERQLAEAQGCNIKIREDRNHWESM
jgi:hypothetical protein